MLFALRYKLSGTLSYRQLRVAHSRQDNILDTTFAASKKSVGLILSTFQCLRSNFC